MGILTYKPITKELVEKIPKIKEVYLSSFPPKERAPFVFLLKKSKNKNISFLAFFDEEVFVGLTYLCTFDTKTYVLYLVTNNEIRSKGYGSQMISLIKTINSQKTIFLSIEEVALKYEDYETRKRRLDFYLKNGFVTNDYSYKEFGNTFETMSFGGCVNRDDFVDIFSFIVKPFPRFIVNLLI